MGPMSDAQQRVLVFLSLAASATSVIGSLAILYNLLWRKKEKNPAKNQTFERIMLAMAIMDIAFSIAQALQPFLTPRGSYVYSIGNNTTCRIMGMFQQISFAASFYYASLSFYFLLVVRFGIPRPKIAKRYEPFMHAISILWPLLTGVTGAIVDWYDVMEVFPGCWVDNYPKGCETDSRECISPLIAWLTTGSWYIFVSLSLIVNNVVIYLHVRNIYRQSRKGRQDHSGALAVDPQVRRLRQVSVQCYLFVCVFFLSTSPFFIMQILESVDAATRENEQRLYPVWVFQAALTPLTGLFNAIVFFRPRYIALRSSDGIDAENLYRMSRMEAIWRAVHEPYYGSDGRIGESRRRRRLSHLRQSGSVGSRILQAQASWDSSISRPTATPKMLVSVPEPIQISLESSGSPAPGSSSAGAESSSLSQSVPCATSSQPVSMEVDSTEEDVRATC